MGYNDYYSYGPHMSPFGGILDLVFWVLVVWLIVTVIRRLSGRRGWMHHDHMMMHGDRAMMVLKERYAKGEINKEEFEQKKKDLEA